VSGDPAAIIGRIYDAAIDSAGWSGLLCDIADLCGAENAALVISDSLASRSTVITPRADPAVVAAYGEHWWQHDPTVAATAHLPVGQVTTLANTGRERFFQSAFHNEFWRHSGLGAERVATNLIVDDSAFSSFVLQASSRRDEISDEARATFSLLVPHLVRAVEVNCKVQRLEILNSVSKVQSTSDQTGAIVVDDRMRLVHADVAAEDIMRAGSAITVSRGVVSLRDPEADARLRAAVGACGEISLKRTVGERIQARQADGRTRVTIDVMPYRKHADILWGASPAALLLVADSERARHMAIERLRDRFGLTRAEAMLSLEMLKGDGRAAAAGRCGISINTARTHLTRIFEKTGVNRQAELIRVIMDAGNFDRTTA